MSDRNWELHFVTDRALAQGRDLLDVVKSAVAGGVDLVQLREKQAPTREFVQLGKALVELLAPTRVKLIVNDRVDVALAIGADGVHIGQSDMDYLDARRLMGEQAVIGLSVESLAQARAAQQLKVDYLGVSPIFTTPTKAELKQGLGLDGLRQIRQISKHPLIAIGGINRENVADVLAAGADGIAVVSAIAAAADPQSATRQLLTCMSRGRTSL